MDCNISMANLLAYGRNIFNKLSTCIVCGFRTTVDPLTARQFLRMCNILSNTTKGFPHFLSFFCINVFAIMCFCQFNKKLVSKSDPSCLLMLLRSGYFDAVGGFRSKIQTTFVPYLTVSVRSKDLHLISELCYVKASNISACMLSAECLFVKQFLFILRYMLLQNFN